MNIKITYNWLLDYLDTEADPYEIQKYLSLCGPSVESVEKVHDQLRPRSEASDFVFDIEITSNRIDTASVFGITQEALAILPQFNKKTFIKFDPLKNFIFKKIKQKDEKKLNIEIKDPNLVFRISAVVLSGVKIGDSPKKLKQRLLNCGINPINNVVDVSNYIRVALGQPCHIFDYDSIAGVKMIIRKSTKGETLITLDKEKVVLPGEDIVISDANGNLIDQPGIMGAFNSSVKSDTKNIILFVPIFNGQMVRRTSMLTGKRSDSASYFEKGLDEERTEAALVYGATLLQENAKAVVSSKIIDIYKNKYKPRKIIVTFSQISNLIGQNIDKRDTIKILKRLGFNVTRKKDTLDIIIPSYRKNDVFIKEDIVEEVARIFGYFKISSNLQSIAYVTEQKDNQKINDATLEIKKYLKHIGLTEIINNTMISKDQIINFKLHEKDHIKLSNPISIELEYLRTSLIPSLLTNIKNNLGKQDTMKLFEVARTYHRQKDDLPKETTKLTIITNTNYFDLKGIVEALFSELNIVKFKFEEGTSELLATKKQSKIKIKSKDVGDLGLINKDIRNNFGFYKNIYVAELDLFDIIQESKKLPEYKKPSTFSTIKLDLTVKNLNYEDFKLKAYANSQILRDIQVMDKYQDNITFRLFFSSYTKNLTEKEALIELGKIKKDITVNH